MAKTKYRPLPILTEADIRRFWSMVDQSGGPDACWPWKGRRNSHPRKPKIKTYGQFDMANTHFYANRVAYFITSGEDPGEFATLHSCDNPPCCNGHHISKGTQGDNVSDAIAKGRRNEAKGEQHGSVFLNTEQVIEARVLYKAGLTRKDIRQIIGTRKGAIRSALFGWRHVPGFLTYPADADPLNII